MKEFLEGLKISENILRYSLYLDFQSTDQKFGDLTHWFDNVNERARLAFQPLFNDGAPYFFGQNLSINAPKDLSVLCSYEHYSLSWGELLKYHSVFNAFSLLRSLIGRNNPITAYMAVKYNQLPSEFSFSGLDYLLKEKMLKFSERTATLEIKAIKQISENAEAFLPNKATNFNRNVRRIEKYFQRTSNLEPECIKFQLNESKNKVYSLANLEILSLLQQRLPIVKHILKGYSFNPKEPFERKDYLAYCDARNWIYDYAENNECFTRSDKLYFYSQIEQLFNFDLIDALFHSVTTTSEYLGKDLTSQPELELHMSCAKLPNYFSRIYLLQMLYDCCKHDFYKETQFFAKYRKGRNIVAYHKDTTYNPFSSNEHLTQWNSEFFNFIRYMTLFAFPVYSNLFLCLLFDDLTSRNPDMTPVESIITLYESLSEYLSQEDVYHTITHFNELLCERIQRNEPDFPSSAIYTPLFPNNDLRKSELEVYHRCILAANSLTNTKAWPLLNKEYLSSIANHPDTNIQSYFVLSSIE